MGDNTGIEWTDATWNPVTGCTKVSPGCDHCYAETLAERFRGTPGHYFEQGFDVQLRPDKLDQPLRWKKPRRIFVNSMSDLFHDDIPDEYIARVFAVMALAPQHTFQVLTKRHARMRSLLSSEAFEAAVFDACWGEYEGYFELPLPNVWLGVSTEDQKWADIRIPALLATPAAVRFVSAEPLLGAIDLHGPLENDGHHRRRLTYWLTGKPGFGDNGVLTVGPKLDWVIVGGESGRDARPMHPDWVRTLRNQCVESGVAFHFKQWGEWAVDGYDDEHGHHANIPRDAKDPKRLVIHRAGMTAMHPGNPFNPFERGHPNWATAMRRVGKKNAGRELDGRTWDQQPEGR